MSRDLTHAIRLRDLRADAETHGLTWAEPGVIRDNEAADFTGAEVERLRDDTDRRAYERQLQADTLDKIERQA